MKKWILTILVGVKLLVGANVFGQNQVFSDTIKITVEEADKKFLENNLLLLASKYDIEAAKAEIIQARLWENPSVYYEQNIYNPQTKKYFDASQNGEFILQASQLITLAGKRNKRISLGKTSAEIAEYQFFDLLRTLKYELRTNLIELYFLHQSYLMFENEIRTMRNTVHLYQTQYEKGNIPLKEVIRLKAFLFNMENESKELLSQIIARQTTLHVLFNDKSSSFYAPVLDHNKIDSLNLSGINLQMLIDTAYVHRHDLLAYRSSQKYEEQNLAYQKSLAVPDLRIGGVYDRNGNYIPNYYAVSIEMDLPLLNRNQGNIEIAKRKLERSKVLTEEYENRVEAEVAGALGRSIEYDNLFANFDSKFTDEFDRLIEGILSNYEKRNITLIEFIDFYQAYKASVIQMNQLQTNRMNAFEELNFSVGKPIIKY
jgi:cobalt-zinc-cadmium efflux system outer membrane protein